MNIHYWVKFEKEQYPVKFAWPQNQTMKDIFEFLLKSVETRGNIEWMIKEIQK